MNVVFVAPYFGGTMLHCMQALLALDGVKLGVISNQSEEALPSPIRSRLAGHFRVDNALDAGQIAVAVRAFQQSWGKVDRLLAYLEQLQVPVADARDATGVAGMSGSVARNFRDKNRMKEVLRAAGLPVAKQALVKSGQDAVAFVDRVGYPIVLKPVAGLGSKNTMRVNSSSELYTALNQLMPSEANPVQAEEFVQGEEHTLEAVTIGGKTIWRSSTYYLPGPLEVLENPFLQYCVLLPREQERPHVRAFAETNARALRALGMQTGFSHMEWFLRKDGTPVISEVGARPPGVNIMGMNGRAHGVDMWSKWAELMVFGRWQVPERQFACGCAFLRGQGQGRTVVSVDGIDEVQRACGERIVEHKLPRPGQLKSAHYEGEGWVMVQANTTDGAVDALRKVVTGIRVRLG